MDKTRVVSKLSQCVPTPGPLDTPCLLWPFAKLESGHGTIRFAGKPRKTHRVAWELARGEIPQGLCVLHKCDVPACCNVEHLWLGTNLDNIADRHAKGRDAVGDRNGSRRCPDRLARGRNNGKYTKPHRTPRGLANGAATHTDDMVSVAVQRYKEVGSYDKVAAEFGVCRTTVKNWVSGKYRNLAVACMQAMKGTP